MKHLLDVHLVLKCAELLPLTHDCFLLYTRLNRDCSKERFRNHHALCANVLIRKLLNGLFNKFPANFQAVLRLRYQSLLLKTLAIARHLNWFPLSRYLRKHVAYLVRFLKFTNYYPQFRNHLLIHLWSSSVAGSFKLNPGHLCN